MTEPNLKCQGKANAFAGSCDRKPTVERGGNAFCWQHDPERLSKQALERRQKRAAELAAGDSAHEERLKRRDLLKRAGLYIVNGEDAEALARLGGLQEVLKKLVPAEKKLVRCGYCNDEPYECVLERAASLTPSRPGVNQN